MAAFEAEDMFFGAEGCALLLDYSPVAGDDSFGLQVHIPRVAFPEVIERGHCQVADLLSEDVFLNDAA